MFYRARQTWDALFPKIQPLEIKWAQSILTEAAFDLFLQQSLAEQRHALDVAQVLAKRALPVSPLEHTILMTAALLHDCGKSLRHVRLWQRIFVVIMQKLPEPLWQTLEKSRTPLSFPLRLATRHAEWGSSLARQAGLNEEVCLLIRHHHSPVTELGKLLKQADDAC